MKKLILFLGLCYNSQTVPNIPHRYNVPITCFYTLDPWVKDTLWPILKQLDVIMDDIKNPENIGTRASYQHAINLIDAYADKIQHYLDEINRQTPEQQEFFNRVPQELHGTIRNPLENIISILRSPPRRNINLATLKDKMSAERAKLKAIEADINFVDNHTNSAFIPAVFGKGSYWIDTRPYCIKQLTPTQRLYINPEEITFQRNDLPTGTTIRENEPHSLLD